MTLATLPALLQAVYGQPVTGETTKLKGEASTRRYYRFVVGEAERVPNSCMVMQLAYEDSDAKAASRAQGEAFLDVQRLLLAHGLPVPRVYASDLDAGLIVLEDLGDESFEARLLARGTTSYLELYGVAIDLLAELHVKCDPAAQHGGGADTCIAYRKRFDTKLLRWELDHFLEWGVVALHGAIDPALARELAGAFDGLCAQISALPDGFVHRDYQSRNLIWAPPTAAPAIADRLCLIDFQDAFVGPAAYDLVALLCDSYVELDAELQRAMLARYAERRGLSRDASAALERGFRLIAVQRKLKDAGRFVFIDRVRGNPAFLPYYPRSLRYVARALAELSELDSLRRMLASLPVDLLDARVPHSVSPPA